MWRRSRLSSDISQVTESPAEDVLLRGFLLRGSYVASTRYRFALSLVPRLQPRNTLLRRLLPPTTDLGGRSLRGMAFQGWSPGTRGSGGLLDA
jgi:hypothetical protein